MTTMTLPEQPVESAEPESVLPQVERPAEEGIADGIEHHLDPRAVVVQRISGWLTAGPILAGLYLAILLLLLLAPLPGWARALLVLGGAAVTVLLAWLVHHRPVIAHRHASYKVDGRGIEIRRGVLWRTVIHVPISRVQHTDVSQGPLERSHGLATLILYTAGTSHARVDLHGLDRATALRIRDHFVSGEGDDAV
jgi:membrane protein YdbS with pleckstrin-like domain